METMKDELGIDVTPERIAELEQHFMFRSDTGARDVGLILRAQRASLAQVAAEKDAARREVERLTAENDQIRSVVYEMVQPTINSMGESWLFDPRHEDDDRASLTTSFGALRRARQVFPSGMFRYQNPALHPFVPLSGSQDTGGRYTRCSVVGCTVPPEGHPK